jgi:hypothetical protein
MAGMRPRRSKKKSANSRARRWGRREATTAEVNLPKKPSGLVAAATKRKINELRNLEKEAFGERHGKTDFYKYLKGVYKAWDWTDAKESRRVGRNVAALNEIDVRKNRSPIRTVIDASSGEEDRQVKSKWVQALEYAMEKGVRGTALITFLKKNGGVEGCARKMAKLRKKRSQSKRRKHTKPWA